MIAYPEISPEIISIGPLSLRWYGLMYVIGFVIGFQILKTRIRKGFLKVPVEAADTYVTYLVIGMLLGARLVYAFVYNWEYFSMHLGEIFAIWTGGLSFHGAALGMVVASALYAHRYGDSFSSVLDTLAFCAPLGLFFGRLGNFINAELYGRATDVPWAMIFPTDPQGIARHPSQLYQAVTEGLLLFVVLVVAQKIWLKRGVLRDGMMSASFIAGYGVFRFFVEYTREPDAQLGLLWGETFSMGQILCLLMVAIAVAQFVYVNKSQPLKKPKPIKNAPKPNFFERIVEKWVA